MYTLKILHYFKTFIIFRQVLPLSLFATFFHQFKNFFNKLFTLLSRTEPIGVWDCSEGGGARGGGLGASETKLGVRVWTKSEWVVGLAITNAKASVGSLLGLLNLNQSLNIAFLTNDVTCRRHPGSWGWTPGSNSCNLLLMVWMEPRQSSQAPKLMRV